MKNIKLTENTKKLYRERGVEIEKVEEAVYLFFEKMKKNELGIKDMEAAIEIAEGHFEIIRRKIRQERKKHGNN